MGTSPSSSRDGAKRFQEELENFEEKILSNSGTSALKSIGVKTMEQRRLLRIMILGDDDLTKRFHLITDAGAYEREYIRAFPTYKKRAANFSKMLLELDPQPRVSMLQLRAYFKRYEGKPKEARDHGKELLHPPSIHRVEQKEQRWLRLCTRFGFEVYQMSLELLRNALCRGKKEEEEGRENADDDHDDGQRSSNLILREAALVGGRNYSIGKQEFLLRFVTECLEKSYRTWHWRRPMFRGPEAIGHFLFPSENANVCLAPIPPRPEVLRQSAGDMAACMDYLLKADGSATFIQKVREAGRGKGRGLGVGGGLG